MDAAHRRKRIGFAIILVLLVGVAIEALGWFATSWLRRHRIMPYIPHLSDEQLAVYLNERNAHLGWGAATDDSGRALSLSPRPDPSSSTNEIPCVSAYGDSFTFGSGVRHEDTYPHYLAVRRKCPVANFGVRGYGSDQALMLFRSQIALDRAPVVVIGHLSENILRNVNQYRNLLYPGSELVFKPRYLLEGAKLRYVPLPINSSEDYRILEESPETILAFDALLDRPRQSFPHSVALLRFLTTDFRVRAKISGIPFHTPYYRPDHPTGGLQLTTRILASFTADARSQGKTAVVLLIPTGGDLLYAKKANQWADQALHDALVAEGVSVIAAGPRMLSRLGDDDPERIFQEPHGHFSGAGNKMLADIVAEEIEQLQK